MHAKRDQARPADSVDRSRQPAAARSTTLGVADVLALQRSAGNHATQQRLLQRAPSGLRASTPTTTFSSAALDYWKDPAKKAEPVAKYVEHLIQKANDALTALQVFPMVHALDATLWSPGNFDATTWTTTLNPTLFSKRPGVTVSNVEDLTPDEAAAIASTVYHEARHAEQHFRIARIVAGASTKQGNALIEEVKRATQVFADAAKDAAGKPLLAAGNAALIAEAKDWEVITTGFHGRYRNIVNTWDKEVRSALNVPFDALRGDAARKAIEQFLAVWRGPQRLKFVKDHIAAVKANKPKTHVDTTVLTHLNAIAAAMTTVGKEWANFNKDLDKAGPKKVLDRFNAFKKKGLAVLEKALHQAYLAQPTEADAHATGVAVGKQFLAGVKPAAPAKPAAVKKPAPPVKAGVP